MGVSGVSSIFLTFPPFFFLTLVFHKDKLCTMKKQPIKPGSRAGRYIHKEIKEKRLTYQEICLSAKISESTLKRAIQGTPVGPRMAIRLSKWTGGLFGPEEFSFPKK